MAYTKQTWADLPSKTTPINASRLGHIEQGIFDAAATADSATTSLLSKQPKTLDTAITVDGTSETTVEGALGAINTLAAANKTALGNLGTASAKNSTDAVTEDSTDLVESGAVYDAIEELEGDVVAKTDIAPVYSDDEAPAGGLSAGDEFYLSDGNLYRATTTISAGSAIVTSGGSANAEVADDIVSQIQGVYDTIGWDESKNILSIESGYYNGTNGAKTDSTTRCRSTSIMYLPSCDYLLSGTTNENKILQYKIDEWQDDTYGTNTQLASGEWTNIDGNTSLSLDSGYYSVLFRYSNQSAISASELTISLRSYTVKEMLDTKTPTTVIGNVEDGASPSKSYAVGEHMIRGGKFCTVTSPVTTGSTWTLNTNYVEGTVADTLAVQSKSATLGTNATTDGISLGSFNEILIQGNIAVVNIRFAVSADITTGQSRSYFNLGITPFGEYSNRCILRKSDSPFEMVSEGAYIANNGVVRFSYVPLTAGNYDLFAVLMIK